MGAQAQCLALLVLLLIHSCKHLDLYLFGSHTEPNPAARTNRSKKKIAKKMPPNSSSRKRKQANSSMIDLLDLPLGFVQDIAKYLTPKDLLSFASVNQFMDRECCTTSFWKLLGDEQYGQDRPSYAMTPKQNYIFTSHLHYLPRVHWQRVEARSSLSPRGREGHLSCRLGNFMIITGGFTEDVRVYVKHVDSDSTVPWNPVVPDNPNVGWVYGATLTALDETRAVRFGGFCSGGYSNETSQVAVLTVTEDPQTGDIQARWRVVECQSPNGEALSEDDEDWNDIAGRAYHSSLLLFDRFLFVAGGMQASGCTISPMLLDTETWTWYTSDCASAVQPSGRHGASIIDDTAKRSRLVLFGGGSGTDLLHTGTDNSQVWELQLHGCRDADTVVSSFSSWTWRSVHETSGLQPTAKLNLGRCHEAAKINNDTLLFAFGSGRPSCNSLLGYNLAKDEFFFIHNISGSVPKARFTATSIYLNDLGYWIFHGGFSSHYGDTLGDSCVLDVAGGMGRPFDLFPVQRNPQSYPYVTNEEVDLAQRPRGEEFFHIVSTLMADRNRWR